MTSTRASSLETLGSTRFDLLVIGAGILGSRVAYEAARAGMTVALVDAGDFGGATSSASSKLLHGGFRYLAAYRFGLVREAQRERRVLAQHVAPHLVWPCPLVVALPDSRLSRRLKLATGIAVYGALAGFRPPRPRLISGDEAARLVPSLDRRTVGATGVVAEMQTHDGRLTLATVKGAVAAGATAVNYARVVSLRCSGALVEDVFGGGSVEVACRAIVNAAGPWLDDVRRLADPRTRPVARLSAGTQTLLALPEGWRAGLALFDEKRSVFAVPWQGMLLVGATDTPFDGDPAGVMWSPGEVRELIDSVGSVLETPLGPVLSSYCGLRVLPLGPTATTEAPREHVIDVSPSGMVSVGGGKLTTHRRIAVAALRRLPSGLRPRRLTPSSAPLPGAAPLRTLLAASERVGAELAAHLISLYGAESLDVVESGRSDPLGLERIDPAGPDVWAQVRYAVDREWALTADDVLRRRTTVALRGLGDERARVEVEQRLRIVSKQPALV